MSEKRGAKKATKPTEPPMRQIEYPGARRAEPTKPHYEWERKNVHSVQVRPKKVDRWSSAEQPEITQESLAAAIAELFVRVHTMQQAGRDARLSVDLDAGTMTLWWNKQVEVKPSAVENRTGSASTVTTAAVIR